MDIDKLIALYVPQQILYTREEVERIVKEIIEHMEHYDRLKYDAIYKNITR